MGQGGAGSNPAAGSVAKAHRRAGGPSRPDDSDGRGHRDDAWLARLRQGMVLPAVPGRGVERHRAGSPLRAVRDPAGSLSLGAASSEGLRAGVSRRRRDEPRPPLRGDRAASGLRHREGMPPSGCLCRSWPCLCRRGPPSPGDGRDDRLQLGGHGRGSLGFPADPEPEGHRGPGRGRQEHGPHGGCRDRHRRARRTREVDPAPCEPRGLLGQEPGAVRGPRPVHSPVRLRRCLAARQAGGAARGPERLSVRCWPAMSIAGA